MKVSEQLKMAREWRKLSQEQLAKKVGATRQTISEIENDGTNTNKNLLKKISKELNYEFVISDEG